MLSLEDAIFETASVDFSKPISLKDQVNLNRFLRAQQHFLSNQEAVSTSLMSAITDMAATVIQSLPELAAGAFAVPLISLVRNPGLLLDRLINSSLKSELRDIGVFAALSHQLYANLCNASGIASDGSSKKAMTWPSDSNRNPEDLVDSYLANTPLQKLLLTPLPFSLPDEQRFAGHWVIAPPGRGKTTLLHAMIMDDLTKDASLILIDSKGDLIDPIKRLGDIADRVLLIEPDPAFPLALNPLDIPRANVNHAVSLLEYIFSSLLDAKMTSLQMTLFRSVLPALVTVVPNPTLETFRDIITNGLGAYRAHLDQLPPTERQFFFDKHNGFESKTYQDTRNQLAWRLQFLMSNPVMRSMFNAPKTKLDIAKAMDEGRVILINNSKSVLGDEGAEFFGRFFIALILAAAEQRSGRTASNKLPCYVYVDECQTVIRRDTKIATILDECRSQKIGLILAHQRTEQIKDPDVLSALSNCAIRFANSDDEAKYLHDKLRTSPEFLRSLGRGRFAAFVRDLTPSAVAIDVTPVQFSAYAQLSAAEIEQVRQRMHQQYGSLPSDAGTVSELSTPTAKPNLGTPDRKQRSQEASAAEPASGDADPGEPSDEW
jgi:hypothetical protein